MSPPITCAVTTFNEESRIAHVLQHATQWADEVLVLDKSSTDRTRAICADFGPRVRVVDIPFSAQGDDHVRENLSYARNDWIFITTCSEVPTRPLIDAIQTLLTDRSEALDLVQVPRRIVSFGVHHPDSPWNICHYPFLLHRQRAIISDRIHANFTVADPTRMAWIPYSNEVCVHHLTHATAEGFIKTHATYVVTEMRQIPDLEVESRILSSLAQLRNALWRTSFRNPEWFSVLVGWSIYHLGIILIGLERLRGVNIPDRYRAMKEEVLIRHWGLTGTSPTTQISSTVHLPARNLLLIPLHGLVVFGYAWLFLRNPRLLVQIPQRLWQALRRRLRI